MQGGRVWAGSTPQLGSTLGDFGRTPYEDAAFGMRRGGKGVTEGVMGQVGGPGHAVTTMAGVRVGMGAVVMGKGGKGRRMVQ